MTDGFGAYMSLKQHGYQHESVNHAEDEYVRGDVHTNTVENYFSILKRGITPLLPTPRVGPRGPPTTPPGGADGGRASILARMPRPERLVSLHPLSPVDALAALLRVPPPPKTKKPATAKRRASKTTKKRPKR